MHTLCLPSIRAMTEHFTFYFMCCNFLATHNSHVCNFRARQFNANFCIRKLINYTCGICAFATKTAQRKRNANENQTNTKTREWNYIEINHCRLEEKHIINRDENYARRAHTHLTSHISHSLQLIIDRIFFSLVQKQSDFHVCSDSWYLAFVLVSLSTCFFFFISGHLRETLVYNQYCSRSYIVSYAKPMVQFGQSKKKKKNREINT